MSLEYALVTDSSLPNEVKGSDHYIAVDKKQWMDLVDYSENIVNQDSTQKILFLIVAKGTSEQEAEDERRRLKKAQDQEKLEQESLILSEKRSKLKKEEAEKAAALASENQEQELLRQKSKTIFNALYNR
jgi:hypothetical protein